MARLVALTTASLRPAGGTFLNTAHGANVVHGGRLIAIVGTESLVILGTVVAPNLG